MQLIDKDKVDEILRNLWKEDDGHNSEHRICYNKALQEVQCEIDTLDVKEVDLDKEIDEHWGEWAKKDGFHFIDFAKYFLELGLKLNQKGE